jgi:hypothetical protein
MQRHAASDAFGARYVGGRWRDPSSSVIPVDYRDNHRLMEIVHPGVLNLSHAGLLPVVS